MCEECPADIQELARRMGTYMAATNWSGGGLHIVISDNNHETHHIQWCLDTQNLNAEETWIAKELLKLPVIVRHGVQALADDGSEQVNGVPGYHASWDDDDAH